MSSCGCNYSNSTDSDDDEPCCSGPSCRCAAPGQLKFDFAALQNLILTLVDKFDMRVFMDSLSPYKHAPMVATGLTLAGCLLGRHYGGNLGAAVGGAVGGICGVGIMAVSMSSIWEDVKEKLWELFDIVYDYLGGLGLKDYKQAASAILDNEEHAKTLAMIISQVSSQLLQKKVTTSIAG